MYQGHTVGVVIPAHNEEGFVGTVIETIPAFVDRIYVIDDRSTDGTWREIQAHADRRSDASASVSIADGSGQFWPSVVPIRHDRNRGRGAAVKTGYRRAMEDDIDVVAVLDGDGQMDPDILDQFVAPIVAGEVEYTKGNRLSRRDHLREMSRWRRLGNQLLTYLTKVASGYWRMSDPQNGYTAIDTRMLNRIDIDGLYDRYGFLNDMLVTLNIAEARIGDVSMPARYGDEQSGIRYSTFVPRLSALLLRDFWWRLKTKYVVNDFHPLVQLYAIAVVAALSGVSFLGWLVGTGTITAVGAVLALVLVLVGGLSGSLAMAFDRIATAHLEREVTDWTTPLSTLAPESGSEVVDQVL